MTFACCTEQSKTTADAGTAITATSTPPTTTLSSTTTSAISTSSTTMTTPVTPATATKEKNLNHVSAIGNATVRFGVVQNLPSAK